MELFRSQMLAKPSTPVGGEGACVSRVGFRGVLEYSCDGVTRKLYGFSARLVFFWAQDGDSFFEPQDLADPSGTSRNYSPT